MSVVLIGLWTKSLPFSGPPEVVVFPGNYTVEAGSTVLLACVGFGDPAPSVSWNTDGDQLRNNSQVTIYEDLVTENGVDFVQSTLVICSAEENDGREYSCNVCNALGNASVNFQLSVTATGGMCKLISLHSISLYAGRRTTVQNATLFSFLYQNSRIVFRSADLLLIFRTLYCLDGT